MILFDIIKNKNHKKESICDTCCFLLQSGSGGGRMWNYYCSCPKRGIITSFDKPPDYCAGYKLREKIGD